MTRAEHIQRHQELHRKLDELVADYLTFNRGRLLGATTVMELVQWSAKQTTDPDGEPAGFAFALAGWHIEHTLYSSNGEIHHYVKMSRQGKEYSAAGVYPTYEEAMARTLALASRDEPAGPATVSPGQPEGGSTTKETL